MARELNAFAQRLAGFGAPAVASERAAEICQRARLFERTGGLLKGRDRVAQQFDSALIAREQPCGAEGDPEWSRQPGGVGEVQFLGDELCRFVGRGHSQRER